MVVANKTLGPLHLEDLEPHRFEDLVRQLLYDFRPWQQLEATGRSGSDDGFDARGYEVCISPNEIEDLISQSDDSSSDHRTFEQKVWLVQCKREKSIGPKKLAKYLEEIPVQELKDLYGIIFVAWCDFSKQARDEFRSKVVQIGLSEAHLWGKAEIEDLLFQPKNDHLLFAYTGISLQVRRRGIKAQVRSALSIKRKAHNLLSAYQPVLIRDVSDDRFPFLDNDPKAERFHKGRWLIRPFIELSHRGLIILVRRYFAYVDDDGVHWDCCEDFNDALSHQHEDPWDGYERANSNRNKYMQIWQNFPEKNRAWMLFYKCIAYDNIIAFDDINDGTWEQGAQVLVEKFDFKNGPFDEGVRSHLKMVEPYGRQAPPANARNKIEKFCAE